MSDLIRREDVLKEAFTIIWNGEDFKVVKTETILSISSAEPERHRGEWMEYGHERGFSECSKCGYIAVSVLSERLYNF